MATLKSLIMAAIMLAAVLVASGCSVELPEKASKEARLYAARCGICHAPFHPQTLSLKQWKNVIKKMEKRVEIMGVREPLTEEENAVITGYLGRYSRGSSM